MTRPGVPRASPVGTLRIGCSGWHYNDWAGRVYAEDLPKTRWLPAYAERFDTVEVNNSFYRLPSAEHFSRWRESVPASFVFAVKASRYVTHFKRLTEPAEPLERLLSRARYLGSTLGPLLYQLPPDWVPDEDRMRHFLKELPLRLEADGIPLRHVIEFRDPRSYSPAMLELLEEHEVALCVHDMPGCESPRACTAPFVYVRLHGFQAKYGGSYPPHVLQEWGLWLDEIASSSRDGYVYFNNDREAHAVRNAETLRALVVAESPPAERQAGM